MVLSFAVASYGAAVGARVLTVVNWLRFAARALRYRSVHKFTALCQAMSRRAERLGSLVSYTPLASGRVGVITSVPAAQRTLDFPGSGRARRPFLASLASLALAWFGWIFVCFVRGLAGVSGLTQ